MAKRPEKASTRKAREYCDQHTGMESLRLAKLLYREYPAIYSGVEHARSAIRKVRGNHGEYARKHTTDKTLFRPNGTPEPPKMPPSKATPWEKFKMPGKCVLVMNDAHVPYHDPRAIETAVGYAKEQFPIDAVLLNGDTADMHSISRWERSPESNDLAGELNAVRQFLVWLSREFPRKPIVYKMGNHEERMEKFYWNKAPELFGLPHVRLDGLLSIDDDLEPIKEIKKIQFVGDRRPIMLGKLPVFHGHELPKGGGVNVGRWAFLRLNSTGLVGHHHRSSSHPESTWDKDVMNCWAVGCLCDLTPEYARINKWNLGFAVVNVFKDGMFDVHNFKMIGPKYEVRPA